MRLLVKLLLAAVAGYVFTTLAPAPVAVALLLAEAALCGYSHHRIVSSMSEAEAWARLTTLTVERYDSGEAPLDGGPWYHLDDVAEAFGPDRRRKLGPVGAIRAVRRLPS